MTIELKLPDLGENIEAGDVITVLVAVGDTISEEQSVIEVETDKATIEIPSSVSGVIQEILVKVGDQISIGQTILTVADTNGQPETTPDPVAAEPTTVSDPAPEPAAPEPPPPPKAEVPSEPTKTTAIEVKLPDLGENIEAGDIVAVLVAVGDTISKEQSILEVETDKATIEIPASAAGIVTAIQVKTGDQIKIGETILVVEGQVAEASVAVQAASPAKAQPAPPPTPTKPVSPEKNEAKSKSAPPVPTAPAPVKTTPGRVAPASPSVRRLARELGVDINQIPGNGPAGRISDKDVKRYVKQLNLGAKAAPVPDTPQTVTAGMVVTEPDLPDFSKWGEVERKRMTGVRRATARAMVQAWTHIPHVTQFDKADITEVNQLRKRFAKKTEAAGGKLTVTAILLKIVAAALKQFPQFNASIDMKNQEVVYKKYYHVGIAVDTDRGLLVPSIRNVDQKSMIELAVELGEVAAKARDRKLSLDEMQGSTFTITNLGGIGGTNFTPIVNYPEVAILGVARGGMEPVYRDGQVEPRLMMPLALSYDHRLVDGADAARFLRWVCEALEQPFLLLLEG